MSDTVLLDAALSYAEMGWAVFPLQARGKKPLIRKLAGGKGYLDATTDEAQIRTWWEGTPHANIGVACGESGIVVVDLDAKHNGLHHWKALCAEHGISPASSVMSKTGGGGAHIFYQAPSVREIKNSAGLLAEGVDVRGVGGYIVAPPSVHPSGRPYSWLNGRGPANSPSDVPTILFESAGKVVRAEAIDGPVHEGERDTILTSLAGTMRRRGLGERAILAALLVVNADRCSPPLPDTEVEKIAKSIGTLEPAFDIHLTDLGNARLLVKRHGHEICYVPQWNAWMIWTGTHWEQDQLGSVMQMAKGSVLSLYTLLPTIADKEDRKRISRHVLKSEGRYSLESMVKVAQSDPAVARRPEVWDTDQWLLNTLSGTVNLRTGELRPADPKDQLTKMCPVEYDPTAKCPQWLAFLSQVMQGREDLVEYLQRAVGYALTGNTGEQVFFILYGEGANGKSTFTETIAGMLGGYAQQVPTTTLMITRPGMGDPPRGDLARLRGIRLATAIETEADRRLAEALVKQMTGGDRIVARYPYGRHFEYTPTHKIFLATNHRPTIKGQDYAIWRRIHLVPFEVTIPPADQVRDYGTRYLHPEWPGILKWAVDGCLAWQSGGLGIPDTIRKATEQYKVDMNPLSIFVSETCELGDDLEVKGSVLWDEYIEWCTDTRERRVSRKAFSRGLSDMGLPPVRKRDGAWHTGIAIGTGSAKKFESEMQLLVERSDIG